jgi:nitrile hydratase
MNGAHDMGGTQGFGAVTPEPSAPGEIGRLFKQPWERRLFGLTLAMGATGSWNIDMSRHARENQPPAAYLEQSYYQVWLHGLETLLLDAGLVTRAELDSGRAETPASPVARVLKAEAVPVVLAKGAPTARDTNRAPVFAVGDRVVAKVMAPAGHTRLPRYVRGRPGRVVLHHGAHVFPDAHAHGGGEAPQHLYTVSFDARDLWGEEAFAGSVRVDCWESYLELAA